MILIADSSALISIAIINQIRIIGSLGVLLLGKKNGYIKSIKPKIEILKSSDIFFSEELLEDVMKKAGE